MELHYLADRAKLKHRRRKRGKGRSALSILGLGQAVFGHLWKDGAHLSYLAKVLAKVADGKLKRVIIELPPRHAKSTMVCELFVPWYLSRHPDKRVIYTSYAASRATIWGRRARDVLENYIGGVEVRKDERAANSWSLANARGGMLSAGVGGPIIGAGADLFVIDDPVRNDEDADSPLIREKIWEWYSSTAKSRLEPGAAVVIIMHRWRKDDLVGQILEEAKTTGEKWEVVRLPALADESGDLLGRDAGKALWPERFDQAEMEMKQRTTPPRWWNALYMQTPMNEDGAEWPEAWLTWDGIWVDEFPEEPLVKVMSLDPSKGRQDKPGDYSAYSFLALGRDGCLYWGADLDNRRSAEKIVTDGLDWVRVFQPDGFGIESDAFQELFAPLFRQAAQRAKVPLRFTAQDKDGPIVKTLSTGGKSKVGRIRQWGKHLAAHFAGTPKPGEEKVPEVRFVRSMRHKGGTISLNTEVAVKQLMEFPHCTVKTGGHDDGPDSGELGLRLLKLMQGAPTLVQRIRDGRALR